MVRTALQPLSLLSRPVRLFLLTAFLVGFAFDGGIYTVLLNLFLLRLGYGPEAVGQVNAVGLLVFALAALPAGLLTNRWGSRRMMMLGLVTLSIGGMTFPLMEFVPQAWQLTGLFLCISVMYAGLAAYFVNSSPFLMAATGPAERNLAFSAQVAILLLAAFGGSFVGGLLPGLTAQIGGWGVDQAAAYRYPLFAAGLLVLPAYALLAGLPKPVASSRGSRPPIRPRIPSLKQMIALPLILTAMLVIVRFLQVGSIATTVTFFNVYLDEALTMPPSSIGILAALGRLMAVPAVLITPSMARRWGNYRLIIAFSLLTALSLLPIVFIPHWAAAGLTFMGVISLSSMRYTTFIVFSLELVRPDQQGALAGIGETAGGLSFAAMAFLGGYIITGLGYPPLFLFALALTLTGTLLFWLYFRRYPATSDAA